MWYPQRSLTSAKPYDSFVANFNWHKNFPPKADKYGKRDILL
jgi:hypothetical protein